MIILHYFLDIFNETEINLILEKIKGLSSEKTLLWVSDFHPSKGNLMQKLKIRIAIVFFKVATNLSVDKVSEIQYTLQSSDYVIVDKKEWLNGFVFAHLLKQEM